MHIIGQLILGLIVGLVARLLLPGRDPHGLIITALVGMAGAWVGGQISRSLGWSRGTEPAGFGMSVLGAMVLLFLFRFL